MITEKELFDSGFILNKNGICRTISDIKETEYVLIDEKGCFKILLIEEFEQKTFIFYIQKSFLSYKHRTHDAIMIYNWEHLQVNCKTIVEIKALITLLSGIKF